MNEIICGNCGKQMVLREVGPCLDCGGNHQALAHIKSEQHYFLKVELFGGETLCDFCYADMPSTDPLYWGFPEGFDWDKNLYSPLQEKDSQKYADLLPTQQMACPDETCDTTLRKQQFVMQNAHRNGITLPNKYWPYLNTTI